MGTINVYFDEDNRTYQVTATLKQGLLAPELNTGGVDITDANMEFYLEISTNIRKLDGTLFPKYIVRSLSDVAPGSSPVTNYTDLVNNYVNYFLVTAEMGMSSSSSSWNYSSSTSSEIQLWSSSSTSNSSSSSTIVEKTSSSSSSLPIEFLVSGTLSPDVTGTYTYTGIDGNGYHYWEDGMGNGINYDGSEWHIYGDIISDPDVAYWSLESTAVFPPSSTYAPQGTATGTATLTRLS